MKWIKKVMEWWNQDRRDDMDLTDRVHHNPKIKKQIKKPRYRQTDNGFIEEPEEKISDE
jgi:hypothetical protein